MTIAAGKSLKITLLAALLGGLVGSGATDSKAAGQDGPGTAFECVAGQKAGVIPAPKVLIAEIEKQYRIISTIKAQFVQETFLESLGRAELSSGSLRFRKPGMIDWQYDSPVVKRFISDGKTLWGYEPEFNQVRVSDFSDAFRSDTPAMFLLGVGRLSADFNLVHHCASGAGIVAEFRPKTNDESFQSFRLLVGASDRTPLGARVVDAAGNPTTILLKDHILNDELLAKQFTFEIPRGTDVLDYREGAVGAVGAESDPDKHRARGGREIREKEISEKELVR